MEAPLVVFDVGSTLIHPDFSALTEWLEMRTGRRFETPLVQRAFRRTLEDDSLSGGNDVEGQARRFFGGLGFPGEDSHSWPLWWGEIVDAGGVGSWLYTVADPEAAGTLQRLADAGCKLAAASNSDGTLQQELAAFGLLRFFDLTFDSKDIGSEKPAPDFYRHVLGAAAMGRSAVHVGDHVTNDLTAPLAAGFQRAYLYDPGGFHMHVPKPIRISRLSELQVSLCQC